MGFFGSRDKQAADGQDVALPTLSVEQANHLRAVTRTVLAEIGFEATVFGSHLEVADGRELEMDALAERVRTVPRAEWEAVVREHVALLPQTPREAGPQERLSDES